MNWHEAVDALTCSELEYERRKMIAAALAARAAATPAAPASAPARNDAQVAPGSVAPASYVTMPEPVAVEPPRDAVTLLETALAAAADDAGRAALLAAASPRTREQLWARSTYRKIISDTEAAMAAEGRAFAALDAALNAAPDDAARRVILSAAGPQFVARWRAHRSDTEDAARRKYLALAGDVDASAPTH
jgi:hypothetical protein